MPGPDPDPDRDLCPLCGFPLPEGWTHKTCSACQERDAPHAMDCECMECDPAGSYRRGGKGNLVDD